MPEETIQTAAEDIKANWIADGTAAAEPVTTETPAAAPTTEAEGDQPRGPDGRFLPKDAPPVRAADTSATPTPAQAASAAPATVPAAGASAQEVQEFIDAQLADGSPFKLPKGVRLPLKRGDTTVYDPVEEIQKRGMLELDYRHKTAEIARQRREHEAAQTRFAADQARIQAREQWLAEQEAEMREAQKDPEKWEAYQELQRMYQTNPRFRQVMDDALAKRETDAENAVYQEREYQTQVQEGVTLAATWIEQLASDPKYQGVNPDRVRVRYAQALTAGQATLDPGEVRALYEEEARYLADSQSPLQKQLADLQAQVEALKASQAAEKHNAKTTHALDRAKTPPVAASGRPPAPAGAPKAGRFGMNELAERNQAWASQRD
jgi:hypothetical protein